MLQAKKQRLTEVLSRLVQARERSLLTSASRRATLPFLKSKTSLSKKKEKMLWRDFKIHNNKKLKLPQRLRVVLRARRRLHPSQLLKKRKFLARKLLNQLTLERALTRLWNTLPTSPHLERRLLKRLLLALQLLPLERSQLRNQLVERNKPQPCHHQVERNLLRLPIKWPWPNSRNTLTGMKRRRVEKHPQAAKFLEREALERHLPLVVKHQRHQRDPRNEEYHQFVIEVIIISMSYIS